MIADKVDTVTAYFLNVRIDVLHISFSIKFEFFDRINDIDYP